MSFGLCLLFMFVWFVRLVVLSCVVCFCVRVCSVGVSVCCSWFYLLLVCLNDSVIYFACVSCAVVVVFLFWGGAVVLFLCIYSMI